MGEKGRSIPYQRIEYLESSGTQYIDTQVFYDVSNKYEMLFGVTFISYAGLQMNGWNAGGGIGINNSGRLNDGSILDFGVDVRTKYIDIDLKIEAGNSTQTISVVKDGANTYTNSRPHSSLATYAINRGWGLFSLVSKEENRYPCHEDLYYCKIYQNDALVRDFVPVRIDTTGYLYDKVSGELFGNAGTGNFVLGPDIN